MEHKKARRNPVHIPFPRSSKLQDVPGIPPKPCFRAWTGSRCLLTLTPLSPGQQFGLGLLAGGAFCSRLHVQPHNSQSPVDPREELVTFSTFLCRWHCIGWRLEAGAVDSEITRAAQEKNLPKGYHRKPSMNYVPLACSLPTIASLPGCSVPFSICVPHQLLFPLPPSPPTQGTGGLYSI